LRDLEEAKQNKTKKKRGAGKNKFKRSDTSPASSSTLQLGAGHLPYSALFFFRTGLEFRASNLQSSHSTAWATPPVHFCSGYLFIFVVLGLKIRAFTLSHSTNPFCDKYFSR
jgi:hypothetical protein